MLITDPSCFENYIDWLPWQDDVRTFFENAEEEIQIPGYDLP